MPTHCTKTVGLTVPHRFDALNEQERYVHSQTFSPGERQRRGKLRKVIRDRKLFAVVLLEFYGDNCAKAKNIRKTSRILPNRRCGLF